MKFSRLQLSFVMILFIGISNHVIILPHNLNYAKRDAWFCSLFAYIILIIWGFIIYLILSKMGNQKLFYWIKERAGAAVSGFVVLLLFLLVLFTGLSSFYELMITIKIYFLPQTPLSIVALCFLLLCLSAINGGFKTIVYLSAILLPLVWCNGIFVALATIPKKDYSFLFPVFIHGYWPVFKGTAVILGGHANLLVLLLLQHHLKKSFSYLNLLALITILVELVIGPTMGVISSFGPNVAANLRFPAFEQWRLVTLGTYITHLDFLAVFQVLAGTTINVALCLFLLTDLTEIRLLNISKYIKIGFSFVFFATIFINSDIWVQSMVRTYIYPYLFIYGLIISILLLIISYLPARKGIQPA